MIDSIAAAKAAGYKKVVLAGQSQGGWLSLVAISRGAKADGAIAVVPGNHGSPPSREARQDFRQLLRDIASRNASDIPSLSSFSKRTTTIPAGGLQMCMTCLAARRCRTSSSTGPMASKVTAQATSLGSVKSSVVVFSASLRGLRRRPRIAGSGCARDRPHTFACSEVGLP